MSTTQETTHRSPIGPLKMETSLAVSKLKAGKPGDLITREEMAEHIGISCELNSLGYGNVQSAIRHVEREHGIVWRWNRSQQAWECKDDVGKLDDAQHAKKGINRRLGRTGRVLAAVDSSKLPAERQTEYQVELVNTGLAALATSGAFRKRTLEAIEGKADGLRRPEPAQLLELMKKPK